jgi:hypothetical protein
MMPIPTPRQDEERSEFLTRCMDDTVVQTEFPEIEQRLAVCITQWDQSK